MQKYLHIFWRIDVPKEGVVLVMKNKKGISWIHISLVTSNLTCKAPEKAISTWKQFRIKGNLDRIE